MLRDLSYLTDILESAKTAIIYLENISIEEFNKNGILQDAVIRRIEIIEKRPQELVKILKKNIRIYPGVK